MKKGVILYHGGGELANQLWNYISVYAFCLEDSRQLTNKSFYEYKSFFSNIRKNYIFDTIFSEPFKKNKKRKWSFTKRLFRLLFLCYVRVIRYACKSKILNSTNRNNNPYYLAPTVPSLNISKNSVIYFDGWLFRNPVGILKFRSEIKQYFKPKKEDEIRMKVLNIRKKYKIIIGIHIRQGDYLYWQDGRYFVEQKVFRNVINEFLILYRFKNNDTFFIITSDGKIDINIFDGLNFMINNKDMIDDLFTLSFTDYIIGSNSSFGNFASYWGDIPHIIVENGKIDWTYYLDKKRFFFNKYATLTHH